MSSNSQARSSALVGTRARDAARPSASRTHPWTSRSSPGRTGPAGTSCQTCPGISARRAPLSFG
eukprot:7438402-Alexandrium_andersonii.AAC.1